MTNEQKLFALKVRLHNLKNNNKNEDSPGVVHKLERKVRNLEEKLNKQNVEEERFVNLSFLFRRNYEVYLG